MKKNLHKKTRSIYRHAGSGRFLSLSQFNKYKKNTVVLETITVGKKNRKA